MRMSKSCSWCHELNLMTGGPVLCHCCGHRADVARADCDCAACSAHVQGAQLLREQLDKIEQQEGRL